MQAIIVADIKGAKPGSIEPRDIPGTTRGVAFTCPGCGKEGYLPLKAYGETRGWSIAQETPLSLTPSILDKGCGWHGYLTNGEFVSV